MVSTQTSRALFLALLLSVPGAAHAGGWKSMLGPGPVGRPHAGTEDDCDACHVEFQGVPDAKCLEPCHSPLSERISEGVGFHASVSGKHCASCHTDHKGRNGSLTKKAALRRFDHADTEFALTGKHTRVGCAKCHTQPIGTLGNVCASCHDDVHEGSLGNDCTACHTDAGWKAELRTRADHRLRMDGGHAALGCADCHRNGTHFAEKLDCVTCHERAHGGTRAACDVCHRVAAWKPATFTHSVCTCKFPAAHQSDDCLACHPKWRFRPTPTLCSGCHMKDLAHDDLGECSTCHPADAWKADLFDHNEDSTFKITGQHLRVDCQRCHPKDVGFRKAPSECAGCHAEQGEDAHGKFERACTSCHSPDGWSRTDFDHDSTGFPLTGGHEKLACNACHPDKAADYPRPNDKGKDARLDSRPATLFASLAALAPPPADHDETKMACVHCHADPHRGEVGGDCQSCHETKAWKPSTFDATDHAATSFALEGEHVSAECASCHTAAGGAFRFRNLPVACADCHYDPHRRQLGRKCADCHNETGFSPVPGFEHAVTSFRLERAHQAIECDRCHTGAPPEQRCASCHTDPHSGQLGQQCGDCHRADRFSVVRFDHDQTGWPLRGRHFVTGCRSCHVNEQWVGLRTECFDCHAEDAGRALAAVPGPFHLVGAGSSCGDCHGTWSFVPTL